MDCEHDAEKPFRLCPHLDGETGYVIRFTGNGLEQELICEDCRTGDARLLRACAACRDKALEGWEAGVVGRPAIAREDGGLRFTSRSVGLSLPASILDAAPRLEGDLDRWVAVLRDGAVVTIDLDEAQVAPLVRLGADALDLSGDVGLRVSRDGTLAAVFRQRSTAGVVIDLSTGRTTMQLARDGYQAEHCDFPVAFLERDGRQLLVHSPEWNRLDVCDPRTGECLTTRTSPVSGGRQTRALDYFHCGLTVSPGQRFLADNGWVWHPLGCVTTVSLDAWLGGNVWETDDGPTRRSLCWREYFWDGPLCWLDDSHLALWGFGRDEQWLMPAVRIFDVETGREDRWFPGPKGAFTFDGLLIAVDATDGATVWDAMRGVLVHAEPQLRSARFHPGARVFVSFDAGGATVHTLRGSMAREPWCTDTLRDAARRLEAHFSVDALRVLGDALESAGCTDASLLAHCRSPGPHAGRCWVVDRLTR